MNEPIKTIVTDRAGETEAPVIQVKMSPAAQVGIRVLRTWIQSFLGFAGLLVVGSLVVDLGDWDKWLDAAYLLGLGQRVLVCAIVATAVAAVSALQNALEFLGRVDATNPTLRG